MLSWDALKRGSLITITYPALKRATLITITYPALHPLARIVPSRQQFGERERGDSGGRGKCSYVMLSWQVQLRHVASAATSCKCSYVTLSRPMSPQSVCTCVCVCVCVCACVCTCV